MSRNPWSRRETYRLAAVAAAACLVRLPIAFGRGWIGYDEANYLMIVRNSKAGLGYVQSTLSTYDSKFHSLSFLVPKALSFVVGDELLASKVLFVSMGIVTVALLGLLGSKLFDHKVGLLAAAMAAVAPVLTSLFVESISHFLFLPLYLAALIMAWEAAARGRWWLGLLAGSAVGLSWCSRADGLLLVPCLGVFLLLGGLLLGSGLKRTISSAVAFAAGFAAFYGLDALVVRALSGGESRSHGPLFDFLVYAPDCQASRDLHSYTSLFDLALAEPQCIVAKVVQNAEVAPSVLLAWTGFPLLFLPLIGAALVAQKRFDRRTLAAHLLVLLSIMPLVFYLPFHFAETRYVAPYAATAFLWCAAGVLAIAQRFSSIPLIGRLAPSALSAATVAFLLAITVLHVPRMAAANGVEYVAAGRWIQANLSPDAILWTSQSQVAFYGQRAWEYPPALDAPEHWQRREGQEVYLVVDGRSFRERNGDWAELVPPASEEGLVRVHTTAGEPPTVAIYRVDLEALERARDAVLGGGIDDEASRETRVSIGEDIDEGETAAPPEEAMGGEQGR